MSFKIPGLAKASFVHGCLLVYIYLGPCVAVKIKQGWTSPHLRASHIKATPDSSLLGFTVLRWDELNGTRDIIS